MIQENLDFWSLAQQTHFENCRSSTLTSIYETSVANEKASSHRIKDNERVSELYL